MTLAESNSPILLRKFELSEFRQAETKDSAKILEAFKTNDIPANTALYRKWNARWHSNKTNRRPADRISPIEITHHRSKAADNSFCESCDPISSVLFIFEYLSEYGTTSTDFTQTLENDTEICVVCKLEESTKTFWILN